jgi:hypothetical protein
MDNVIKEFGRLENIIDKVKGELKGADLSKII